VQNKMADYANANPPYRLMALPQSSSPRLGVATSLETPTPDLESELCSPRTPQGRGEQEEPL
jgi:hypothetical protein